MIRVGVVLVFDQELTKQQAEDVVKELVARGLIDEYKTSDVHVFESDHGGPVWYVP